MKRSGTVVALLCLLALISPRAGRAVITFTQLAEDIFVVSHRVKIIGSRGQAMRLAYTKAASLCVAAGYSHMEIKEQESQAGSEYEIANASVRVKLFHAAGEERLDCAKNASREYIEQAGKKLAAAGYQPPNRGERAGMATPESIEERTGTPTGRCSIEQIVAMVKAGLKVEQIKAACPEE